MPKNTQSGHVSTATHPGPKPGDFPLASVESRAAARVRVQRLAEADGPQDGDIFIEIADPTTAAKIMRVLRNHRHGADVETERIPGARRMWLRFPNGCDPVEPGATRVLPKAAPEVINEGPGS